MTNCLRLAFFLLLAAWASLQLGGCGMATKFNVAVSSLAAPGSENARRYFLVPGNQGVTADDLQYQEFASYVDRAMQIEGFTKVSSQDLADIIVTLTYAISEPETHTYTYAVPHWGQTGVSSATTYGTANTFGTLNTTGNYGTYSGSTSYSGTTYYQPTYGVTGYSTGVGQFVTFTRSMGLIAYDAASTRSGGSPKEVWRVGAASTGSSGDLRLVFRYLTAGVRPYLGKPTDRAVDLSFSENDSRVLEILPQPAGAQPSRP